MKYKMIKQNTSMWEGEESDASSRPPKKLSEIFCMHISNTLQDHIKGLQGSQIIMLIEIKLYSK